MNRYQEISITALLSVCGLLGNIFAINMFFGVHQIFGSIFVLISASILNLRSTLIVAIISHSYLIFLWKHPYASINFVLEALFVAYFYRKKIKNLFVIDVLFWSVLGAPIAYVCYKYFLGFNSTQVELIVLKQPINALFNAIIANIIIIFLAINHRRFKFLNLKQTSMKDIIFTTAITLVIFFSFYINSVNSNRIFQNHQQHIKDSLITSIEHFKDNFKLFIKNNKTVVNNFCTYSIESKLNENFQFEAIYSISKNNKLELVAKKDSFQKKLKIDIEKRVYIVDKYLVHKIKQKDREIVYIQKIAYLQDIFNNKLSQNAILNLENRKVLLISENFKYDNFNIDIFNKKREIYHLINQNPNLPPMRTWFLSSFASKIELSSDLVLITKLNYAPYIDELQKYYIESFRFMLMVIIVTLIFSYLLRNSISVSINRLANITTNLPEKLKNRENISWPNSSIEEISSLTENIQNMSLLIDKIFKQNQKQYETLFNNSTYSVFVLSFDDLKIVDLNQKAQSLIAKDIKGSRVDEIFENIDSDNIIKNIEKKDNIENIISKLKDSDISLEIEAIKTDLNNKDVILLVAQDITQQLIYEANLKLASTVFENTEEGILITDENKNIIRVNSAFEKITGYSQDDVINQNPNILSSRWQDDEFYEDMWRDIDKNGFWQGELVNRSSDGELFAEWLNIKAIYDDNQNVTNYIGVFIDITDQKRDQEQVKKLAYFDILTNLPNRVHFKDKLNSAIESSKRENKKFAIFFIDLDNFKTVNDTLGHHMGDLLLQQATKRIKHELRNSDTLARLGGDEFTLLLENIEDFKYSSYIAIRVIKALCEKFILNDKEVFISASIGICFYPENGETSEELMKNADTAMYIAKSNGKNSFEYFNLEMNRKALERLDLENSLRQAIEKDEISVYYQPKVDIKNGEIIGAEALMRWNNSKLGFVSPDIFIPIAEENGTMKELSQYLIELVCKDIKNLNSLNIDSLKISINISNYQFKSKNFHNEIIELISEYGISPKDIDIELTERIVMNNLKEAQNKIENLKKAGFTISIDDFGTGQSSLSYLKKFNIDCLKIDKSFVFDITEEQGRDIVIAIISIAKALNMNVTAEGVESIEHLNILKDNGCNDYQGYHFSKPLPFEQFVELFK